jgi:hypothetical protein
MKTGKEKTQLDSVNYPMKTSKKIHDVREGFYEII